MWPSFSKLFLVMGGTDRHLHRISPECFAGLAYLSFKLPRRITASIFIGVNFHAVVAISDEPPQNGSALRFSTLVVCAFRTSELMEELLPLQH
jgi:hypothetical protein